MLTQFDIENTLKRVKPFLEENYFVSKIGYFGSYAIGLANEKSDIDILVDFNKPLGWEFFDLQAFLEMELKTKVDLTTVKALKEQLKTKILAQVKYV
ncbi:MAG: nucleotidyltransferase family protein [Bacteroidetes bacterium]|nr:nucleotidyltransferase family protein [Bacteroidota bacterium]